VLVKEEQTCEKAPNSPDGYADAYNAMVAKRSWTMRLAMARLQNTKGESLRIKTTAVSLKLCP
jgi:hypothetical protein